MKTLTFAAFAALLPVAGFAHDGVAIRDAYARSANPASGAAFMVIENHRAVECTLLSAASDAAGRVELHTHLEEDGVMRMTQIEGGITIAPEDEHALLRGGDHVMLLGLTAPLADGDSLTLVLDFGDCGTEEVEIVVDNQRSDVPEGAAEGHAHH